MANWSAPAPTAPDREHWLHDQEQLPPPPKRTRGDYVQMLLPIAFGVLFSAGLVALAFEARSSWESHRDWVVPMTVPLIVLGGIALVYLIQREAWLEMLAGLGFLLLLLALTGMNIARGATTEGDDLFRDILSVLQGITLGLTVIALVAGAVYVELTRPTRAPQPEM